MYCTSVAIFCINTRIEPMRVILRQGHIGHNFYFIYSGSVFVNINDVNDSGVKFSRTEVILTKGDSFGVTFH